MVIDMNQKMALAVLVLLLVVGSGAFVLGKEMGRRQLPIDPELLRRADEPLPHIASTYIFGTVKTAAADKIVMDVYEGNVLPTGSDTPVGTKVVSFTASTSLIRLSAATPPAETKISWSDLKRGERISIIGKENEGVIEAERISALPLPPTAPISQ